MKKQRDALQNERKYVHVRYSHDDPLTVVLLLESAGFVTMIESKEMSYSFFPLYQCIMEARNIITTRITEYKRRIE